VAGLDVGDLQVDVADAHAAGIALGLGRPAR
jgi:hypothetical protein